MPINIAVLFALPFLQIYPGLGPDICMDPSYDLSEFCPLDRDDGIPSIEEFQLRQDVHEVYLDPGGEIPPLEEILRNHVIAGVWHLDHAASDSIPARISPGDNPYSKVFTAAVVRIEQTGAKVVLHYPDFKERILYTDGRGMVMSPAPAGARAFVAAWGGQDRLVVETAADEMRLYESYSLSPDGEKMLLSVTIKSNLLEEPVKAELVYNRQDRAGSAEE